MIEKEIIQNYLRKLAPFGTTLKILYQYASGNTKVYNVLVIHNDRIFILDNYLPYLGVGKGYQANFSRRQSISVNETTSLEAWEVLKREIGIAVWNDENAFYADVSD